MSLILRSLKTTCHGDWFQLFMFGSGWCLKSRNVTKPGRCYEVHADGIPDKRDHRHPFVILLMSWWIICESKISINLDAMVKDLGGHAYWSACSDFNLATASFSARSFKTLLEILATVIPCWFLRITASIPVVLFDKSMSEADWILPVLMANSMAVLKELVSAMGRLMNHFNPNRLASRLMFVLPFRIDYCICITRWSSYLQSALRLNSLVVCMGPRKWWFQLLIGSICRFSVDLGFVRLLCIVLDLDWLVRWLWNILPLKNQSQLSLGQLLRKQLLWSSCSHNKLDFNRSLLWN